MDSTLQSMVTTPALKLSRGFNHLGEIAKTMGDLSGLRSVIHELIQNADDAPGATQMSFSVTNESLEVWNDGEFTRCSDITSPECEQLAIGDHRCDFHSFRSMGSGDKRSRPGTTGAFGIGFTAVYQLTDRPELISNGEHWVVDEMESEDSRITRRVSPGGHSGTTFRFPWATSPSPFRTATRQQIVTRSAIASFASELIEAVPLAMPFLRHLRSIEIEHAAKRHFFELRSAGRCLEILSSTDRWRWFVLNGQFEGLARELRAKYPDQIEAERSATVSIAFPLDNADLSGVLYAFLPTEESSHLPVIINADFYPASDRKRIRFDDDPESMFNRAAIQAAAKAIAARLQDLPDELGDAAFVEFLIAAMELVRRAKNKEVDRSYREFWSEITEALPQSSVVPTAEGNRFITTRVRLWREVLEGEATAILARLGIHLVHPDHKKAWYRLRGNKVEIGELGLGDIATGLRGFGAFGRQVIDELPGVLANASGLDALWRVVELLMTDGRANPESRNALMSCAIVPGTDGAYWPFRSLVAADTKTMKMLRDAGASVTFLDGERFAGYPNLSALVEKVDAVRAIEILEQTAKDNAINPTIDSGALLRWFWPFQLDLEDEDLQRLARLPIFPTTEGPRPLIGLSLPGDFEDPLRLTRLVAVDGIEDMRPLLGRLGAKRLTFHGYCADFVPQAVEGGAISELERHELLLLLASRLSEIRDDQSVRKALLPLAIIPCDDGEWRSADKAYLSAGVRPVLGSGAIVAAYPTDRFTAHQELYRWLGVASEPRPEDVIRRCREMVAGPAWHRPAAQAMVEHLARRFVQNPAAVKVDFAKLNTFGWLPAEGDQARGYRPEAVFTVFRKPLFSSQAKFLDLPQPVQQAAARFLDWLGVKTEPTPPMVVAHLIWCSDRKTEVSKAVWIFLNNNASDPSLGLLMSRSCLLLDNGYYVRPANVYWGIHPFGRWRYTLGPQFRSWQALLDRLGVVESPRPADAIEVLRDIAAQHSGEKASLLPADVPVIQACWRLLTEGLASEDITSSELAELHNDEVVLDAQNWLRSPEEVFFRDSLNLADRFDAALRARLVERPEGLWPALAAAGVRNLSDAVSTEVVNAEGNAPEGKVVDRLNHRKFHLLRLLGDDPHSRQRLHEFYEEVSVRHLKRLEIQQSLDVQAEHFSTAPYQRAALYLPIDRTLYCVERSDAGPVWVEVAREFIRALRFDRGHPPALAFAVKDILEAETEAAAAAELDELGFPALDPIAIQMVEANVAEELGGIRGEEIIEPEEEGSESVGAPGSAPRGEPPLTDYSAQGGKIKPTEDSGQREEATEPDGTIHNGSRPGSKPTGPSSGQESGTAGGTKAHERGSPGVQSRMRSYVAPAPSGPWDTGETDAEAEAVERAGVIAVLAYERDHGRTPTEMPPMNAGFDVRSVDAVGMVRIIEVKSSADRWGVRGVALSSFQFTTAQQRREEFWLYVVENAATKASVHPINDPASKVDQYFFDDGWRTVSEAETSPRPVLEPLEGLLVAPASRRGRVPYFEASNPRFGVQDAEDGWILCREPKANESWFAARITGYGLGLAFYGGVAFVEVAETLPQDGELALVRLHNQFDPDSGSHISIRRWTPERDLDGKQLALRLWSEGNIEPLTVTSPDRVKVLGLVRAKLRIDDI